MAICQECKFDLIFEDQSKFYYINRMEKKNIIVISIDVGKNLTKFNIHSLVKKQISANWE